MTTTPDYLIDRIKLKRQIFNWRMIAVIAVVLFGLLLFSPNQSMLGRKVQVMTTPYIARVVVEGVLYYDRERLDNLKEIANNDSIKAVIMHINSPGGSTVGGESLYKAIKKVSERKPVVAIMDDIAASAGYMVALGSDYMIGYGSTITGSIGALIMTYEVTELAKKLGIKFNNVKSSKLKGGPLPTEEFTEEMRSALHSSVMDEYKMFVSLVSERRKIPLEQLYPIADGRIYTGRQALENKLIDAIGDEDLAIKWLSEVKGISSGLSVLDIRLEKEENRLYKLLDSLTDVGNMIKSLLTSRSF